METTNADHPAQESRTNWRQHSTHSAVALPSNTPIQVEDYDESDSQSLDLSLDVSMYFEPESFDFSSTGNCLNDTQPSSSNRCCRQNDLNLPIAMEDTQRASTSFSNTVVKSLYTSNEAENAPKSRQEQFLSPMYDEEETRPKTPSTFETEAKLVYGAESRKSAQTSSKHLTKETGAQAEGSRTGPNAPRDIEAKTVNIISGDFNLYVDTNAINQAQLHTKVDALREQLREVAWELAGNIDLPIGRERVTRAVALQVSKFNDETPQELNEMGQFTHRDELNFIYQSPKGDLHLDCIFEFATQLAVEERALLGGVTRADEKMLRRKSRRILIIGQAGIGKTVLTKMLAIHVLEGKIFIPCEFLFLVSIRNVNFKTKRTLLEVLIAASGCEWDHSDDPELWEQIRRNPRVLIILDGLDEAESKEMLKSSGACNPLNKCEVSAQLKQLISGSSLPDATVVATSRPRQGQELHRDVQPRTVLRMLGLDEESRDELGKDVCRELWSDVQEQIMEAPQVHAICYVPVFFLLVVLSLRDALSRGGSRIRLDSVTKILVCVLDNFVESESKREQRSNLLKLARLAFVQFRKRNYIFDKAELAEVGLEGCQSFLSTWEKSGVRIYESGQKSYFSHLVWQEIFAAIHILFFGSEEDFRFALKRLQKRRWEMVARCLFGLCHPVVADHVRAIFDVTNRALTSQRREALVARAIRYMKEVGSNALQTQDKMYKLLKICSWVHEMEDGGKRISRFLPGEIKLRGNLFPGDASSLVSAIRSSGKEVMLNVSTGTTFFGNSMFLLFDGVLKINTSAAAAGSSEAGTSSMALVGPKVQLRSVFLSRHKITDKDAEVIASCLAGVEVLYIDRTQITECGLIHILQAIASLQLNLKELNLTENVIGDKAATWVAKALKHVQCLFLLRCQITTTGIGHICSGILQRNTPMQELNLRGNPLNETSASAIAQCLHKIKGLYIHQCGLDERSVKCIVKAVGDLKTPMDDLYLQYNALCDRGAAEVATCLHKVGNELRLDHCGITPAGYQLLYEAHRNATQKPEVYLGHLTESGDEIKLEKSSS